ncbi:GNAT family N-acetyltransferase [Psychrobium sp. MM17-31]|uniref:GNAT family N-acetyltransferase n=1 Tax=Psychrobium sp. MM17-31 TaxID=2917758 RepID=UPI001EF46C26|nr:GNAT family N-acetyltransferase [Psychrobium sp. MM17-31]MCG7529961.1 GNAT family N-acetyltransferase [Psychrobium sp. MM17-31]
MIIQLSDKLALKPLLVSDAPALFRRIEANRTMLATYLYWVKEVVDEASCRRYIDERANSELPKKQWFGVYVNDEISGVFAIKSIDENGVAELGYWLSEHAHGHGVISRCVDYLAAHRADFGINSLEFHCLSKNIASISIAKKAGANYISTITDYFELDGQMQDLLVYRAELAH